MKTHHFLVLASLLANLQIPFAESVDRCTPTMDALVWEALELPNVASVGCQCDFGQGGTFDVLCTIEECTDPEQRQNCTESQLITMVKRTQATTIYTKVTDMGNYTIQIRFRGANFIYKKSTRCVATNSICGGTEICKTTKPVGYPIRFRSIVTDCIDAKPPPFQNAVPDGAITEELAFG